MTPSRLAALLLLLPAAACQKPSPAPEAREAHAGSEGDAVHTGASAASTPAAAPLPDGAVRVEVGAEGYSPARIPVKAGQSVKLAFHRKDAENCGDKVVFPALKLERDLPVGQTVLVEVLAPKSGELAFTCGMEMFKGALVVQ
ncbi:cupredoxin domain-containing protein [Aggregicoccus sp. 17bor-14]|uniref:cupredoxin domain-containing protein n=1 Tax=Myxococcaceae TaxID=31 RepID=UPI00129CA166|nr:MULTISPECIES: cupredoxin domain-containing protein [Myxococcaceae]MBF5045307.1 cupredoxin domain-containing protein [Simulacricoccus sp. 17bor-14]MRI91049.1 cupredoxin domain-containing protein [Aggregicoccus sp. 17bor-14]